MELTCGAGGKSIGPVAGAIAPASTLRPGETGPGAATEVGAAPAMPPSFDALLGGQQGGAQTAGGQLPGDGPATPLGLSPATAGPGPQGKFRSATGRIHDLAIEWVANAARAAVDTAGVSGTPGVSTAGVKPPAAGKSPGQSETKAPDKSADSAPSLPMAPAPAPAILPVVASPLPAASAVVVQPAAGTAEAADESAGSVTDTSPGIGWGTSARDCRWSGFSVSSSTPATAVAAPAAIKESFASEITMQGDGLDAAGDGVPKPDGQVAPAQTLRSGLASARVASPAPATSGVGPLSGPALGPQEDAPHSERPVLPAASALVSLAATGSGEAGANLGEGLGLPSVSGSDAGVTAAIGERVAAVLTHAAGRHPAATGGHAGPPAGEDRAALVGSSGPAGETPSFADHPSGPVAAAAAMPEVSPLGHYAGRPAGEENFSVLASVGREPGSNGAFNADKKLQTSLGQSDGVATSAVGTTVAKSRGMSSHPGASLANASGSAAPVAVPASGTATLSPADFPRQSPALSGSQASLQSTAKDAVATVIKLAEVQATRTDNAGSAQSVNLGFRFGEEHLSVRVELRGTDVHTQFTTSSADLRAAVAAEWATASGTGGGQQHSSSGQRPYHFAPPQFSAGSSFSDGRGGRNPFPNPSGSAPSSPTRLAAGSVRSTATVSGAAASPQAVPVSSGRLHAFA